VPRGRQSLNGVTSVWKCFRGTSQEVLSLCGVIFGPSLPGFTTPGAKTGACRLSK
jgi:hypothetical protein